MPMDVVANRCSTVPSKNSGIEPSIGTPIAQRITTVSDTQVATSTTSAMAHTLASMISAGVTGMTSKCSTVPCSRSRINAAPVRMMESMVTMLISSITEPNHAGVKAGLNRARTARSMAGAGTDR